jgi:hypothetical protein
MQRKVSYFVIQAFVLFTSLALSCIYFQSCMLSNEFSNQKFNAISHEYHAQIVNLKPSPLYSIQHLTYPHQNIFVNK